jgi:hypothetical protein
MEEVEYIIASRKLKNITEYLVKWVGYEEEDNTWVSQEELEEIASDELIEFRNRQQREKERQIAEQKKQKAQAEKASNPNSPQGKSPNPNLRNVRLFCFLLLTHH